MQQVHNDDNARRKYWQEQMDMAYDWMMAIRDYPVEECGEIPVSLQEAVTGCPGKVRVLFSTRPHFNQADRLFYLRSQLIEPFLDVAREMNRRGWILKVEDAYRTKDMQKNAAQSPSFFDKILEKTLWECHGETVTPELMFRRITVLIATLPKIGTHMSASAMDISVFESDGQTQVDRGAPYLELSELTPMNSPFISQKAQKNRREITAIWTDHGFVAYPFEFWHYSKGDAYDEYVHHTGRPARYQAIDWNPQTPSQVRPLPDPLTPLISFEDLQRKIARLIEQRNTPGK